MEKIKITPLTKEQLLISADRLTRFKNTEVKYLRVFKEIITGNLITPKFKKQQLDETDYQQIKSMAETIINFSLEALDIRSDGDFIINQRLYDYENSVFELSQQTKKLLQNKINYKGITKLFSGDEVKNLKWLEALENSPDIIQTRKDQSLLFPVEKVIICEGITEETLLPVFADIYGFNFARNGIHIISAGGKNQVVKTYYELAESLKLPIFVLLDKDASDNLLSIKAKQRDIDDVYILTSGEFEDLLPVQLVARTLDYAFENISLIDLEFLKQDLPKVKILEEIFKNRGLHEFKKSEFAGLVKLNIKDKGDLSEEIIKILNILQGNTSKKELF